MTRVVQSWYSAALVLLLLALPVLQANAHEIRPGLLDIRERDSGWFDVTWKVPMRGDRALAVLPMR